VFPNNSMNLDFDKNPAPDDNTVKGITLHETGHALGSITSIKSGISVHGLELGPDFGRIQLAWQYPGGTRAAMRFNLQRLSDDVLATGQHTYTFTAYDQASIMHYSFPSSMFLPGQDQCRVDERYELSAADKEAMKDAYARSEIPAKGAATSIKHSRTLGLTAFANCSPNRNNSIRIGDAHR